MNFSYSYAALVLVSLSLPFVKGYEQYEQRGLREKTSTIEGGDNYSDLIDSLKTVAAEEKAIVSSAMPPCDGSPYDICEDLNGDLNGDSMFNIFDYVAMLTAFGSSAGSDMCPCPCYPDLNGGKSALVLFYHVNSVACLLRLTLVCL